MTNRCFAGYTPALRAAHEAHDIITQHSRCVMQALGRLYNIQHHPGNTTAWKN